MTKERPAKSLTRVPAAPRGTWPTHPTELLLISRQTASLTPDQRKSFNAALTERFCQARRDGHALDTEFIKAAIAAAAAQVVTADARAPATIRMKLTDAPTDRPKLPNGSASEPRRTGIFASTSTKRAAHARAARHRREAHL